MKKYVFPLLLNTIICASQKIQAMEAHQKDCGPRKFSAVPLNEPFFADQGEKGDLSSQEVHPKGGAGAKEDSPQKESENRLCVFDQSSDLAPSVDEEERQWSIVKSKKLHKAENLVVATPRRKKSYVEDDCALAVRQPIILPPRPINPLELISQPLQTIEEERDLQNKANFVVEAIALPRVLSCLKDVPLPKDEDFLQPQNLSKMQKDKIFLRNAKEVIQKSSVKTISDLLRRVIAHFCYKKNFSQLSLKNLIEIFSVKKDPGGDSCSEFDLDLEIFNQFEQVIDNVFYACSRNAEIYESPILKNISDFLNTLLISFEDDGEDGEKIREYKENFFSGQNELLAELSSEHKDSKDFPVNFKVFSKNVSELFDRWKEIRNKLHGYGNRTFTHALREAPFSNASLQGEFSNPSQSRPVQGKMILEWKGPLDDAKEEYSRESLKQPEEKQDHSDQDDWGITVDNFPETSESSDFYFDTKREKTEMEEAKQKAIIEEWRTIKSARSMTMFAPFKKEIWKDIVQQGVEEAVKKNSSISRSLFQENLTKAIENVLDNPNHLTGISQYLCMDLFVEDFKKIVQKSCDAFKNQMQSLEDYELYILFMENARKCALETPMEEISTLLKGSFLDIAKKRNFIFGTTEDIANMWLGRKEEIESHHRQKVLEIMEAKKGKVLSFEEAALFLQPYCVTIREAYEWAVERIKKTIETYKAGGGNAAYMLSIISFMKRDFERWHKCYLSQNPFPLDLKSIEYRNLPLLKKWAEEQNRK